jgi:hypothetical protein
MKKEYVSNQSQYMFNILSLRGWYIGSAKYVVKAPKFPIAYPFIV